jgi:predicted nucleic acid-binding protein
MDAGRPPCALSRRVSSSNVLGAIALHRQVRVSFWDAMIVHAAAELGCDVLWSVPQSPVAGRKAELWRSGTIE